MGMESSSAQLQPPPPPPRLRLPLLPSPHFSTPPPPLVPESFPFSDLQLVVSGNGTSKPPPPPPPPLRSSPPPPPLRSPLPPSPSRVRIDGTGDADEVEEEKREEREHKRRSKNWTRLETLTLIRTRAELNPKFCSGGRKRELWGEISDCLYRAHFSRDAQQCRDKWEKLMAGYKDVIEGFKDPDDNPYFVELHPLMSKQHREEETERKTEKCNYYFKKEEEEKVEEEEEEEEEYYGNDDQEEGEESFNNSCSSSSKRKRKHHEFSAIDMNSVKYMLETVIAHQHKFFRELLETMERNEQAREKVRIEKEEKWRAEERAHREVLNKAMLLLTQAILRDRVGDGGGNPATMNMNNSSTPGNPVSKTPASVLAPKKRSKNWKRGEVLQLIQLRGEMDSRFVNSTRRGVLWEELAEALDNRGIKRDGKQCREKWDKLMASYKDVMDGKRDEGDLSYFSELKSIVGSRSPDNGFAGCSSGQFEDSYRDKAGITRFHHHHHRQRLPSEDILLEKPPSLQ